MVPAVAQYIENRRGETLSVLSVLVLCMGRRDFVGAYFVTSAGLAWASIEETRFN